MSPAVRFLAFVMVGWAGVRFVGPQVVDASWLDGPDDGDETRVVDAALDAPRVSIPQDAADPAATSADGAPIMTQAGWPAGAILTPYGILMPYGSAPPAVGKWPAMPRWAAAPPPQPRYRRQVIDVPVPRYVPQRIPYPVMAQATAPSAPLIGYSLADGTPVYADTIARAAPRTAAAPTVPPPIAAPGAAPSRSADRWQLSAWAFLREALGGAEAAPGLAPGSMLGGDQIGARLLYNHSENWGLSARASSAVGSVRGDEVAFGLRYRPSPDAPLAFTIERREAIGAGAAARSAFAAFAETGLYDRSLGAFRLDAYAQGGAVGIENPQWFIDGAATATRPLWRSLSGGAGVWGAAQPGVSRLDIGPRVSVPLGPVRVHADYRYRLTGNAAPDTGATVTVAADF
ncbi:hypothetical protein WJS89_07215 [Sphingomicrobium sp. XHP0235]|uniref:hypothetical protein n=1 Tax=Sphingomicrobium aquimarinum TaxID=3133971 RepID=UPI0031FF21C0